MMMFEEPEDPTTLRPQELEAVYAISRAVGRAMDMETALDEVIQLARPVFIFDNIALYIRQASQALEPTYARAIGRGRSYEADLVWGEAIASQAMGAGQVVIREEDTLRPLQDRTRLRYSLGLPLYAGTEPVGALVFIRFGGPPFTPDQVHLAEFIASHIAQLIGHGRLVKRVARLEAERHLDRLQQDFIATITHELLTPLGFIKGYATTLLRDDITWDDASRSEFLNVIDEEADRLRELIENLMDSSRLQAGTLKMSFQPVRMDLLLKEIALRARTRDVQTDLRVVIQETGVQIQADPTRLAQVFDNLLTNAAKYAPGAPVTLVLEKDDGRVHIIVHDDGPGIALEHLDNLFKRFYRVPTNATTVRGTGLGLFICRQIVHAHGGEISVESELGKGTTFHLHLPVEQSRYQDDVSFQESIT